MPPEPNFEVSSYRQVKHSGGLCAIQMANVEDERRTVGGRSLPIGGPSRSTGYRSRPLALRQTLGELQVGARNLHEIVTRSKCHDGALTFRINLNGV